MIHPERYNLVGNNLSGLRDAADSRPDDQRSLKYSCASACLALLALVGASLVSGKVIRCANLDFDRSPLPVRHRD